MTSTSSLHRSGRLAAVPPQVYRSWLLSSMLRVSSRSTYRVQWQWSVKDPGTGASVKKELQAPPFFSV